MMLSELNPSTSGEESIAVTVFDCPHCVASGAEGVNRIAVAHQRHEPIGLGFSGIIDVPGHWRGVIEPSGLVGTLVPLEGHIVVRSSALFGGGHAVGD